MRLFQLALVLLRVVPRVVEVVGSIVAISSLRSGSAAALGTDGAGVDADAPRVSSRSSLVKDAVRKQAMFWLGQSEDPRALAFFAEVLGR